MLFLYLCNKLRQDELDALRLRGKRGNFIKATINKVEGCIKTESRLTMKHTQHMLDWTDLRCITKKGCTNTLARKKQVAE